MDANIFHLRLPTGHIVLCIQVPTEGRELAASRVYLTYSGSNECVKAGAAPADKRTAQSTRALNILFVLPLFSK